MGLQCGGLTHEDARALERPAMTLARAGLRDRLANQVGQAYRQWGHTSGHRSGDHVL
jgi:hypothetical protein